MSEKRAGEGSKEGRLLFSAIAPSLQNPLHKLYITGIAACHSARGRGRVKSPDMEKAFSLTRARVGQILKPLLDAGLVIREGETRATTYRLP